MTSISPGSRFDGDRQIGTVEGGVEEALLGRSRPGCDRGGSGWLSQLPADEPSTRGRDISSRVRTWCDKRRACVREIAWPVISDACFDAHHVHLPRMMSSLLACGPACIRHLHALIPVDERPSTHRGEESPIRSPSPASLVFLTRKVRLGMACLVRGPPGRLGAGTANRGLSFANPGFVPRVPGIGRLRRQVRSSDVRRSLFLEYAVGNRRPMEG